MVLHLHDETLKVSRCRYEFNFPFDINAALKEIKALYTMDKILGTRINIKP